MATTLNGKTEALLRCNKCGFCLAHCPVYKVTGIEWTAARGRIALIRSALVEEKLDVKELHEPVFNCLTCNACVDDCPAGVQTAEIIFDTREELHKKQGASWINRLVFQNLLPNPSAIYKASRLLRLADVSGLRVAARKLGLTKIMGDAGKAEAVVPQVPPKTGLGNLVRMLKKIENPRYKVSYFVGCYAASLAPEEAAATIRVLQQNRVAVEMPDFACCGVPAPSYGDIRSAKNLAIRNIEIAGERMVDAIVTPCASCGSFLKDYGKLLADQPEWAEKAKVFSSKVKDVSEFLIDTGLVAEMGAIENKVTYHDPCHLGRYQKIKQQPRILLKNIPGLQLIEMREADMCCGAAGTYGFKNYDLSMKVLARKMENVEKTGAEILVSSCPACIMQLSHGAKTRKSRINVLPLIRLLDLAYQRAKSRA